jgi:hypothetical protein
VRHGRGRFLRQVACWRGAAAEVEIGLPVTAPDADAPADAPADGPSDEPSGTPQTTPQTAPLAATGAESAALIQLATLLVLGGVVLLRVSRRKVAAR